VKLVTASPLLVKAKKDWILISTSTATLVVAAKTIFYIHLCINGRFARALFVI
jgi:hypothetical protein